MLPGLIIILDRFGVVPPYPEIVVPMSFLYPSYVVPISFRGRGLGLMLAMERPKNEKFLVAGSFLYPSHVVP